MLTIVGVGHVFAISDSVRELINQRRPAVVCLELDPARFHALTHRELSQEVPLQYRLLAHFQDRMADKFGTEVGGEMLAAASAAKEVGAQLALIDMDAGMVFRQLWSRMTLREKVYLLGGAFIGLFLSRKTVEREMDRYERNEAAYIERLGEEYPTIKEVLIDDRNKFMAEKLVSMSASYGDIVAIVGDGHVQGITDRLSGIETEVIRLKDIRGGLHPPQGGASASTTFWHNSGP